MPSQALSFSMQNGTEHFQKSWKLTSVAACLGYTALSDSCFIAHLRFFFSNLVPSAMN